MDPKLRVSNKCVAKNFPFINLAGNMKDLNIASFLFFIFEETAAAT